MNPNKQDIIPEILESPVDRNQLIFGLIAVFLCGIGFSIIMPVVPFLVQPYVKNPEDQGLVVSLLMSTYAACVFLFAPALGALSDRYGRRPILLICLLGSAIGYVIFGIGGALWVLFLGRIIEGVTGGSISTIFAYFADITPISQRTKYFGWVSAVTGIGVIIGPSLGGLLTHFGYATPLYFGAFITALNCIYGYFFMPESLKEESRSKSISLSSLNPFVQLGAVLSVKSLKYIFLSAFLLWLPGGALQAIFSQMTIDSFNWSPTLIGLTFSIMGIQDIVSQGLIMPRLIKNLKDETIVLLGMFFEAIGYGFIAVSILMDYSPLLIMGMFIFAFGDSIFGPSFNGLISKTVDNSSQGKVQGGSQAIQALARIAGPILGGQIYVGLGHSAPAFLGVIFVGFAIVILFQRQSFKI